MAEKVYEMQLTETGAKYGSILKMVYDAQRVYPWVDHYKINSSLKYLKKRKVKEKEKQGSYAAQVLQECNEA
jgi:hypothetical protein